MSAANPDVYTGVRPSVNETNLDEVISTGQWLDSTQNNKPDNPLRQLRFTSEDLPIANMGDHQLLFSTFIGSYGEIIKNIPKEFKLKNIPTGTILKKMEPNIEVSLLGYGGFGFIFKLHFTTSGEMYVLKCISDSNPKVKRQNRREVKILFHLKNLLGKNDWAIVHLIGASFSHDICFLLYNYVKGNDLYKVLRKDNQAKQIENTSLQTKKRIIININKASSSYRKQIKKIAIAVTVALACIHTVGIIHNDIKPENIMIPDDPNTLPFFIDFGLAAFITEKHRYDSGTPDYMNIAQGKTPMGRDFIRLSSRREDLHAIKKTFLTAGIEDFDPYQKLYNDIYNNTENINIQSIIREHARPISSEQVRMESLHERKRINRESKRRNPELYSNLSKINEEPNITVNRLITNTNNEYAAKYANRYDNMYNQQNTKERQIKAAEQREIQRKAEEDEKKRQNQLWSNKQQAIIKERQRASQEFLEKQHADMVRAYGYDPFKPHSGKQGGRRKTKNKRHCHMKTRKRVSIY